MTLPNRRPAIPRFLYCVCAALVATMSVTSAAHADPSGAVATYSIIDYPGAAWTNVYGISRTGSLGRTVEIVGAYGDATGAHGFLLSGGHYTTLNYPGSVGNVPGAVGGTIAYGINGRHQIVGTYRYLDNNGEKTYGWLYQAGLFQRLFFGGYQPQPHDLSDAGTVVGTVDTSPWLYGFDGTLASSYSSPRWWGIDHAETGLFGVNDNAPPRFVGYVRDQPGSTCRERRAER
jgi:hypothetical protein